MKNIYVVSSRTNTETLNAMYPGAEVVNITAKEGSSFCCFNPIYPVGNIPMPFTPGRQGMSVEGIWQGLKVFEKTVVEREVIEKEVVEREGVRFDLFESKTMKGFKRVGNSKNGKFLGFQKGLRSTELMDEETARKCIYLPCYLWVLENKCKLQIEKLRQLGETKDIVLLDSNTSLDVENVGKAISCAALIKAYLQGNYPECERLGSSKEGLREVVEGEQVWHGKFGRGTVMEMDYDRGIATVNFSAYGTKKLVLEKAGLEPYMQL